MEEMGYGLESLATVAGATAATLLIVQYIKAPLDCVWKIPTRVLVWCVAFAILLGAQVALGNIAAWGDVALTTVNAFVVALAAMGAYEATFAASKRARNGDEE